MLRVADYAATYHGAFPVWMGPTDAFLMTVHPATVRSVLSGSGLYTDDSRHFFHWVVLPSSLIYVYFYQDSLLLILTHI